MKSLWQNLEFRLTGLIGVGFKATRFSFAPVTPQSAKILDLSLRPGFTTDFIADTLNNTELDAVVLQTYGSGNIPMGNQQLVEALKNAVARGVIIVNITQVNEGVFPMIMQAAVYMIWGLLVVVI